MKISVFKNYRGANWIDWEYHNHDGSRWLMISIGVPHRHLSRTFYF